MTGARGLGAMLFVALALSCSGDVPPDGGTDAGTPPLDGSHDAGRDAGPQDAGHDAAVVDAGPPGAWSLVPGLPAGCVVEYTTVASELEPFTRDSCPDRTGCERLVPTWEWGLVELRVDGGVGGDRPMFFFTRDGPLGDWQKWLVDADGDAILGVRGELDRCFPAYLHASSDGYGLVAIEPDGDYAHSWVLGGTWTPEMSLENLGRLSDLVPRGSDFHAVRAGARRIAVESTPWHAVVDVPWSGDARIVGDGADGGETYVAAVIGDTVFYDVYGGHHHVRAATDGERGRVLIDPPGSEAIRILTDGTDMAWIQAYGRIDSFEFGRLELWTSPHAERAEDLVPRRVADLSFTNPYPRAQIGAGHVAFIVYDPGGRFDSVVVYRLADGARAQIDSPLGGPHFRDVAYITATTLATPASRSGSPPKDEWLTLFDMGSLEFVSPP